MVVDIKEYRKQHRENNKHHYKQYHKERNLFRSSKVINGSYDFIKMLEQY